MPGRILNFSEFFGKYSKDSGGEEKNLDSFTQSSSNFEEGFDKDTYDKNQLGPNKPIAMGSESTPPSPGETGASAFSSKYEEEMSAPEGTEDEIKTEPEDDGDAEETPEPEAGANPKAEGKKKEPKESAAEPKNESAKIKSFNQFINETWSPSQEGAMEETCPNCRGPLENMGLFTFCPECDDSGFAEEPEYSSCSTCGEQYDEYGSSCGCNM